MSLNFIPLLLKQRRGFTLAQEACPICGRMIRGRSFSGEQVGTTKIQPSAGSGRCGACGGEKGRVS